MNRKRAFGVLAFGFLFVGGIIAGYLYFAKIVWREESPSVVAPLASTPEELYSLRIYYPVGDQLQMEERRPPRRKGSTAVAEAIVEEYLRGSAVATVSFFPRGARLLGVYRGTDGVLYVDLSDEFRRNFQGDALAEFLLLKGIYESLIANIQDVQDVKLLIEGKELESLGGHLSLSQPLKDLVSRAE